MNQPEDDKEFHQIEDLEHKLYDPKEKNNETSFHHIHDKKAGELPTNWGDSTPIIVPSADVQKGYSFGTKMLFVALIFLFGVLSFTAWRVLLSRNVVSANNIDVSLDTKPYVEGGEESPLTVSVLNRNTVPLQEATITLSYEKGLGVQDEMQKVSEKRSLGSVDPNTLKKEDMKIVLYGAESDTRVVSVKLEYKVSGNNAVFNKTVTSQVVLKTPPLSVHIEGPDSLVQGQSANFKISVSNNTGSQIDASLLTVSLPPNFNLEDSSSKPDIKGPSWNIPSLEPGATSTVTISGSFSSEAGETNTIKASVGGTNGSTNQIGVVYSQEGHSVSITAPLLAIGMRLETDRGTASSLRYGDKAIIYVSYQNKSDQTLRDVSIVANIGGTAPIISAVTGQGGYYNSINKTFTWNKATNNELTTLLPNATGEYRLEIPVVSKGNNSPKLTVVLDGVATSVTKDDTATELSKTWNVQGSATFSAWTLYNNSSLVNSGPTPPKANVSTTYSVHMSASAQNALINTKVSFILPAYVTYTGVFSKDTNVSYDSRTRTVVWSIGNLGAGQVVSNDVQVSVRPSQSHVGQMPPITSGITLEADEADSRAHIRSATDALTTELKKEQGEVDISRVVAN